MKNNLTAVKIGIVGGDKRYLFLAAELLNNNANIKLIGFEKLDHISEPLPVKKYKGNNNDLKLCDAIILPMTGINSQGKILASYSKKEYDFKDEVIDLKNSSIPIFVGKENDLLKKYKVKYNLNVIPFADIDDYAIYNSISTAEGAIEIAMRELPITIHGSKSLVLGFGRVGITLSRTLKALGSEITVACRNKAQKARSYEMSCNYISFEDLIDKINKYDIIFNTIPKVVLNKGLLSKVNKKSLIIDLASHPGGTDFEAAENFGIRAILALGLPGKTAPDSSGKILGKVISQLLYDHLIDGGV